MRFIYVESTIIFKNAVNADLARYPRELEDAVAAMETTGCVFHSFVCLGAASSGALGFVVAFRGPTSPAPAAAAPAAV